jgi:hypothetical protein
VTVILVLRAIILGTGYACLWLVSHPAAAVPLGILGWGLYAHFCPYRPCRWCRPGGLIGGSTAARLAGYKPERKPGGQCWRCKRTRLTRRLGAYHVHKARLSLIQAWEEREFWR